MPRLKFSMKETVQQKHVFIHFHQMKRCSQPCYHGYLPTWGAGYIRHTFELVHAVVSDIFGGNSIENKDPSAPV